jgi:hypothetical protein
MSVKSDKSGRSNTSRKSALSGKVKLSHCKAGKATESGRYGTLPFDADGFCCHHPSVRIAQRKLGGGFKIIHDDCPDCAAEQETTANSGARSGLHRSSFRHKRRDEKLDDDEPLSPKMKKKRIRVKNQKTEDDNGRRGRYSGYVNNEHRAHGEGIMRYDDGNEWFGIWSDGSQMRKMKRESNLALTEE